MKGWYLLYCKRSEQERAVINLDRQGVECYYPQVRIDKIVRGKKQEVLEPLFPSYVFVYFDPEQVSYTSVRSYVQREVLRTLFVEVRSLNLFSKI
ncbi:transcription antitermination protein RfaH [Photobacterium damselae subsp. piscicida]|nr:transcription antitermination protein RfaH [Photobacterium damselae subsp. piscicida]